MNDKQKKTILVGGGALAVGYYVLSQKHEGGASGGMGSMLGKAGGGLSLPGGDSTGGTNPAATVADILSNLPPTPAFMGGNGSTPPPAAVMAGIPQVTKGGGGGAPITKKSTGGGGSLLSLIPKVMAYSVMRPTQLLGGTAAHAEDAFVRHFESPTQRRHRVAAQASNVKKYPRTSHAISMLTGGATARAPVTKKQYQARRNHPVIYHAWKNLFGWLGA